jgi:hypothetical protein
MRRFGSKLAVGAVMALGIALLAANNPVVADDDDDKMIKAAQKDILALAADIAADKKIDPARAAAIRKKYEDLNHLMIGFKPRDKKGIGIGPKGAGDGIELKLNNLGKRKLSPMQLAKESKELLRMASINLAYAEIVYHYAPAKPKLGKGAKEWKQYTAEMKMANREFINAVKAGKPDLVKTAANNINNTCNSCHSDFRDAN